MPPMITPVPNAPRNSWYEKRKHKRIPKRAESKKYLDAFYTGGVVVLTPPVITSLVVAPTPIQVGVPLVATVTYTGNPHDAVPVWRWYNAAGLIVGVTTNGYTPVLSDGTIRVEVDVATTQGSDTETTGTFPVYPVSDANALAYIAAMVPAPTSQRAVIINQTVAALKATGVYPLLDQLNLYKNSHSQQAALLDVINPTRTSTVVNVPVFTTADGFVMSGASSCVQMAGLPDAGANFSQNSAHEAVWTDQVGSSTGAFSLCGTISSGAGASRLIAAISTGTPQWGVNIPGAPNTAPYVPTGRGGGWCMNRSGASAQQLYKDGEKIADSVIASNAPRAAGHTIGRQVSTYNVVDKFKAASLGGSLTAQQWIAFNNIMNQYFSDIPPTLEMLNTVTNNQAVWNGWPVTTNVVINNQAVWN